ncbi:methyltransferase tyw3 [Cystoisospora suis]|uniref:tRNA(Phe) 7-[(3-amino-3-carboxypropyl)-4-demethylwyosine(37)-N(4)]-methyltransferase n=1 Tax=Cystoisospora suis TaxID=483139 RepID=A0A2C6LF49_9APIC|nr:methyltransferase tyw3 [Cystoisospora suis]
MLSPKCFIMRLWGPAAFLFSRRSFTRWLVPHPPLKSSVDFPLDRRLCKTSLLANLQSMTRPNPRWGHLCHHPPNNTHKAGRQSPTARAPRRPRIPGCGHFLFQNRVPASARLGCSEGQTLSSEGQSTEGRRGCCSRPDAQAKIYSFCSVGSSSALHSHRHSRSCDIPVHGKVVDSEALGGGKTTPLHSGEVKPRMTENAIYAKLSKGKEELVKETAETALPPSIDTSSSSNGSPVCFSESTSFDFLRPSAVDSLSVTWYHPFSSPLFPLRPLFSCSLYSFSPLFHFAQKTYPWTPRLAAPASQFSFSSSPAVSPFCQSSPSSIPSPSLASPSSPLEPPAFDKSKLKQPLSRTAFDERKIAALTPIYFSDQTDTPVHPVAEDSSPPASSMSPPLSFRGPRSRSLRRLSSGKNPGVAGSEEIRPVVEGPRDRSRKGSVDKEILPLLNQLNALENFYTSSSCSGRVLLLGIPKEDCITVTPSCSPTLPLNTAQSPVTQSLPSADESGSSNGLALASSLSSTASASSSATPPSSAASLSCSVSSQSRSSTARIEAFTQEDLKNGSDKREGRRRQKHSKIFLLNHHEEVNAELLLQAIRECPLCCEEIWLKVEAPILHVCCRTLQDALSLVKVAKPYAHRAVLLHVSSSSSSADALDTEAEGDPSSTRKDPRTGDPVSQLASLKSQAVLSRQRKVLQSTVDSPVVSPAGGCGSPAARKPEHLCSTADDLGGSTATGNGEEKTESVSVRNQSGASYSGSEKCIKQNAKKTGSGRKRNSERYVVELTGSVQLAMPVLLNGDCWIVPLPAATKDRTQLPHGRGNGSTTQSLCLEAAPTDDADGEDTCRGENHGGEVAVERTDVALKVRDMAGGLLRDDTSKGAAELRKRWECLAQLCNEGLHESRKKFMGLTTDLEKLAETAAYVPSNEQIR